MGDFKIGETVQDAVYIANTATGAPLLLSVAVTCTWVRISNNTRTAGTVQEVGSGWYRITDFTPLVAGMFTTEWAAPAGNTIYGNFKEFKVGGGVLGETNEDAIWFATDTTNILPYVKAAAHVGGGISYSGICDAGMAGSTTIIVCDDLKGFGDDFFNTDYVLTVALNDNSHGIAPETNTPKDVTDYTSLTGTFTTSAFTANVEANDRIVVTKRVINAIDAAPILSTPTVNSLAHRISDYLADGDGDFATGTTLPSNTSLYDVVLAQSRFVRVQNGTQATTNAIVVIGVAITHATIPFQVTGYVGLQNMIAGDTFLITEEIRDGDDVTYREIGRVSLTGVQTSPMIQFPPRLCQGWRCSIQRTAGADRNVTYQFFTK